jgi:hypothetical protein
MMSLRRSAPGLIALGYLLALIVALGGVLFLPAHILEQQVRTLTPPIYPQAELVSVNTTSGQGISTETRVYTASDEMVEVHRWMERAMPGFHLCAASIRADCWTNERCVESWLSQLAAFTLTPGSDESMRPCVSIVLEPDRPFGPHSVIHVNLVWPSH